jgi:hypothetical protein
MIACPRCSLSHKPSVEVCDCGYDLAAYRRSRQPLADSADVRQSAYRWLHVWLVVIKWGALAGMLGGGWLALAAFMNDQPLVALMIAVTTGLSLISSVAAAKGIALLLHLDGQQRIMLVQLSELRRKQP